MGWYWGPLSFTDAEKLLERRPDGTFLVRDSGHDTFFLSLSFRVRGTTYHTRLEHNQGELLTVESCSSCLLASFKSKILVKYSGIVKRLKPCNVLLEGAWESRKGREQERPC